MIDCSLNGVGFLINEPMVQPPAIDTFISTATVIIRNCSSFTADFV